MEFKDNDENQGGKVMARPTRKQAQKQSTRSIHEERGERLTRHRRYFSPEEKLYIVLRGLGYYPIEELCKDFDITPTHFYVWRKQFLQNAADAFRPKNSRGSGPVRPHTSKKRIDE